MIRLQAEPIDAAELVARVSSDEAGAIATFLGTVRTNNRGRRVLYLEYEAYPAMAESEMQAIADRATRRFPIVGVAIVHRTGRLEIGEVSVAIAVSSAHRGDAMDACRFAIEELKRTVPIWKREVFEGGEVWIEGAGESPTRESDDQAKSRSSRSSSSIPR